MMGRSRHILAGLCLLLLVLGLVVPAAAKDYIYAPCSNYLHIIDCDTDTVVKTVSYNDYIIGCAPSADGKLLFLNSWHSIYVFDTDANAIIDRHDFWTDLNRVQVYPVFSVSDDGRYLYLVCSITKKKLNIPRLNVLPPHLVMYDIRKRQIVKSWKTPKSCNGVLSIRNDPNHFMLLAEDIYKLDVRDGTVEKIKGVLHPEKGQPQLNALIMFSTRSPGDHGIFTGPAYSADSMFYMSIDQYRDGTLKMLKAEEVVFAYSTALSPDRKYLYGVMDEVYKIDAETGKTLAMTVLENGTCYILALTADGKKLYVGPGGADITVFETRTLTQIGMIPLKSDGVTAVRISK